MKRLPVLLAALAAFSALAASVSLASPHQGDSGHRSAPTARRLVFANANPRTPIRHVVEIFQENVSFDHYFGTYPHAANTDGNPFHAQPGNAECERPGPGAAGAQPELGQPPAADPGAGADL